MKSIYLFISNKYIYMSHIDIYIYRERDIDIGSLIYL